MFHCIHSCISLITFTTIMSSNNSIQFNSIQFHGLLEGVCESTLLF